MGSFDKAENQSPDGVTTGSYRVNLPDGRVQVVSYTVDAYNGYVADVRYEGEAVYPEEPEGGYGKPYVAPRPKYAPAPAPAYKPAPAPAYAPTPAPKYRPAPKYAPVVTDYVPEPKYAPGKRNPETEGEADEVEDN